MIDLRYISTRGAAPDLEFDDVLLTGLARDGGLYVPEAWPRFDGGMVKALRGQSYEAVATQVAAPFIPGGAVTADVLERLVAEAYAGFGHTARAPLVQVDQQLWLMELFHGPTLAFKDYAMQLLGRLFDHVLEQRGRRATIVVATSGDTGSAAIEACRDRGRHRHLRAASQGAGIGCAAPPDDHGRCRQCVQHRSRRLVRRLPGPGQGDVQRRRLPRPAQPVGDEFDQLGPDHGPDRLLRGRRRVLGRAPTGAIAFSVPTGNFGNVYAAYAARAMGVLIERLIIGSNRNDILTRFFEGGEMKTEAVVPTISPSMDIQVSSNFEAAAVRSVRPQR